MSYASVEDFSADWMRALPANQISLAQIMPLAMNCDTSF